MNFNRTHRGADEREDLEAERQRTRRSGRGTRRGMSRGRKRYSSGGMGRGTYMKADNGLK